MALLRHRIVSLQRIVQSEELSDHKRILKINVVILEQYMKKTILDIMLLFNIRISASLS